MANKRSSASASLLGVSLISSDIRLGKEPPLDRDFSYGFKAVITIPQKVENDSFVFSAEYSISKNTVESDSEIAGFSALYYCAFQSKGMGRDEAKKNALSYAATTIWSNFSSLSALVTNQMGTEFPPLPPAPGHIDMKENSDSPSEIETDTN